MSISISGVKTTLGEQTNSLQGLCTSSKINKWSFNKPIAVDKVLTLTDDDKYNNNDGFYLYYYYTWYDLLDALNSSTSKLWEYQTPDSHYRLSDFNGYDHYASRWINFEWENNNSAAIGKRLFFSIYGAYDFFANFNYTSAVKNNLSVACIICSSYSDSGVYIYNCGDIGYQAGANQLDIDDYIYITIPDGLTVGNTYYVIPCFTTATLSWDEDECRYVRQDTTLSGNWYALPKHCFGQFTVKDSGSSSGDDFSNYFTWNWYSLTYDTDEISTVSNIDMYCDIEMIDTTADRTYNVDVTVTYKDQQLTVTPSRSTFKTGTITSSTIRISYKDNINTIATPNEDHLVFDVSVTFTKGNTSQTKTWEQMVEREQ